ncbi:MAG: prepilin-type N-terminal cleavage/methylation domain-containing protein [candidate division NC10 bacterium]|nr:prepilin-type N-terminal cleavage/methylation domain-containing protein [candidate division NC10 bacterium]
MRSMGNWQRPCGFNVLELTIVVAVFGIVAAIGIPGIMAGIQRKGSDGASRRLAEDLRQAQSQALTRGAQSRIVVFDQTGSAPNSSLPNDSTKANRYRLEVRTSAAAAWPAIADNPGTNANVLTVWQDLAEFGGVRVTTGNTLVFNSQGFLFGTTTPRDVVIQGGDGTKTVRTSVIGKATIQ